MSPQDSDAFFNLGAMYADTKRQEEAVRFFTQTDIAGTHVMCMHVVGCYATEGCSVVT